jgi:hypothetical protein
MFKLNGKPLALDVAFSNGDINYPANWLRHASLSEKNAIGITEVAGPAYYDQRFYYGVGNPQPIADLKTQWIDQQKATAGSLLSKTDWMIIRKEEASTAVPGATQTYRTAVRTQCKKREDQITACSTTDELADLISKGQRAGSATNGATEKKDSDDKSFDPKQYNPIVLEAWPTE